MDDKSFTEKSAKEWIEAIESDSAKVRDQDLYPYLRAWLEKENSAVILDAGCGQGVCSEKIDLKEKSYIGIDASAHLIERARQLYPEPNKKFQNGNLYSLPLPDNSIDAVFTINVWHLLSAPEKAAAEIHRILKPGKAFLIVTANPDAYAEWRSKALPGDVLHLKPEAEIRSSLEGAGLVVEAGEKFRILLALSGHKPS